MKTGLGLNFLRIVNEEGFDGWSQVYARIPLENEELRKKGALFGVVKASKTEMPREMEAEVMMKVDDYFTQVEGPGNLSQVVEGLDGFNYVWVWVYETNDGRREVRLIKKNGGVLIQRKKQQIDLGVKLEDGKVIKGLVEEGDQMIVWVGEMQTILVKYDEEQGQKQVDEMVDELVSGGRSGAALILKMASWEVEREKTEQIGETVEKVKAEVAESESESKPINFEASNVYWQQDKEEVEGRRKRELVSDAYVGKVGPKEKLVNWWKRWRGSKRDLGLSSEQEKRKKWAGWLGLVFLILLMVSVGAGTVKIKNDRELKQWLVFYEPIEKKRQEALGLVEINVVGARKLMEEVKGDYLAGKEVFVKSRFKNELSGLEKMIEETWLLASGEKPAPINTKLDVGLVREGFNGQRLGRLKEGNFLVLDGQMGVVVLANGKTKEIKVAAGKGQGWVDVVFDGKRNVMLDASGLVGGDGSRLVSFDSVVGKAVGLGVFGSNIYVLDQLNKEIYKYVGNESGIGERTRWLKEGQTITEEPVDLAMDSDVWVLEKGNILERFRRGSKEIFSLNGIPERMNLNRIAVEADGDRMALLEADKGMVVIFNKTDGSFKEQLKIATDQKITDVEFDDEGGLWVLAGGVIGKVK